MWMGVRTICGEGGVYAFACYLGIGEDPGGSFDPSNKIIIQTTMQQSKSAHGHSPSPSLIPAATGTRMLQQRLKKEIQLKFNKNMRADQTNSSSLVPRRHHSLLLSNPLTKSSFSLTDALTHKGTAKNALEPIRNAAKSISSKKIIALASRQRYSSFDEGFFKTGAGFAEKDTRQTESKRLVYSSFDVPKRTPQQRTTNEKSNKFKLLFKEKNSHYKSASQRKIARIDSKINALRQKHTFLESLLPVQKPKMAFVKPQPKRYPFGEEQLKEKIGKTVNQLIKTIELYFNMYVHNNIVAGHFKKIEGYNRKISHLLMIDETRAKRITDPKQITVYFQAFKDKSVRSQTFMEEDVALYNLICNYLLKMDKKYGEILQGYSYYQRKRKSDEKDAFRKTREKFEQRMGQHQQINRINHFIENRLRFDQVRRQEYMQNLQKRGVVLNLIERSRELILREKQQAVKQSLRP